MNNKIEKLLNAATKDEKWQNELKREINRERNENVLKVLKQFETALQQNENITHNERDVFVNKISHEHEKLLYRIELDLCIDEL